MREYNNATAAADLAAAERDPQQLPVRTREPSLLWVKRAACRDAAPHRKPTEDEVDDPFYPAESLFYPPREVLNLCPSCPVRRECLETGLENRERGVWGGLTERQRKALKRPRKRLTCVVCGNDLMITMTDRLVLQLCLACGTSWPTERIRRSKLVTESVEEQLRREETTSPRSGVQSG